MKRLDPQADVPIAPLGAMGTANECDVVSRSHVGGASIEARKRRSARASSADRG